MTPSLSSYWKDAAAILGLLVFSVIWLVMFLLHLDPVIFPDSDFYLYLADQVKVWNWTDYHFRTPGYPVFLAAIQMLFQSNEIVYPAAIQVFLTSLTPLLLYGIFRLGSNSVMIGLLAGLVFFIDWSGQLMSMAILTETLSQFLLLCAVLLAAILCRFPKITVALLLSLTVFALVMVRPAFVPLGVAFGGILFLLYWGRQKLVFRNVAVSMIVAVLPLLFTVAWAFEIKRETGRFGISHITGIALLNQVLDHVPEVEQFEKNPELLGYIKSELEAGGNLNVGWDVIKKYGKDDEAAQWTMAIDMKELSLQLIKQNPQEYFWKVVENSKVFWVDSANYVFNQSAAYTWLETSLIGGPVINWTNAQFWLRPGRVLVLLLVTTILTLIYLVLPRVQPEARAVTAIAFSSILICMLTHVMVNGADLARYRLPIQTLFLSYVVYIFGSIVMWIFRLFNGNQYSSDEITIGSSLFGKS